TGKCSWKPRNHLTPNPLPGREGDFFFPFPGREGGWGLGCLQPIPLYGTRSMSAIRFTHLDHCSIIVTDVAKARAFYAGVLGLKGIAKPKTFDFVVLWFELADGQTLHLLQKPDPDTRSPRHLALRVADARVARAHLGAHGVEIQETVLIPHCDRFFI